MKRKIMLGSIFALLVVLLLSSIAVAGSKQVNTRDTSRINSFNDCSGIEYIYKGFIKDLDYGEHIISFKPVLLKRVRYPLFLDRDVDFLKSSEGREYIFTNHFHGIITNNMIIGFTELHIKI